MKIASFVGPRPRPPDAARHIAEEARLVLASLRGGPPYVARGELALGLRELRSFVRGRYFDANIASGGAAGGGGEKHGAEYLASSHSSVGAASAAVAAASTHTPREGEQEGDPAEGAPQPQIRMPPLSPSRDTDNASNQLQPKSGLSPPPPPLPAVADDDKKPENDTEAAKSAEEATAESKGKGEGEGGKNEPAPEQRPTTPLEAPASPTPPTPHSVPPSVSPDASKSSSVPSPPLLPTPNPALALPDIPHMQPSQQQQSNPNQQPMKLDPGPYAAPFLAVIVDPRAAGPHTLVALRSLHRLLARGSIVQLTRSGNGAAKNAASDFAHETSLEPIARGVLACRFEQTDAGADEAVEMAIADLLQLLVELDAAGARAAEAALLRQVYVNKKGRVAKGQAKDRGAEIRDQRQSSSQNGSKAPKSGTTMRIARLPAAVLAESFHAVFVTRQTFVRDGGGHHSPALSFHFEQVLTRMAGCVFGGEDAQSSLKGTPGMISSGHVVAAGQILDFLIQGATVRRDAAEDGKWSGMDGAAGDDERTLCLRLIQCCLQTGWGNDATGSNAKPSTAKQSAATCADDQALSRLIEDDLCLALLNAGQAIWAHHDEIPSGGSHAPSSSSGGEMLGDLSGTSLELLSEVCGTLSLLWSLPRLRARLRSQFEAIFSGFYQRALSLLRRRPLPEDGVVYQANMIFDAEAEVILESLVDVLCLSSNGGASSSLSTIEELFLTYDCSMTESDVASGLLVELSRCCGGVVDEDGEPYLPSMPASRAGSSAPTPRSNSNSDMKPMLIAKHRAVPDQLKDLCFDALLGSLRRLFRGVESLTRSLSTDGDAPKEATVSPSSPLLRSAKNKKRSLHHAARLFNQKPRKGLAYLLESELLPSPPDAKSVASFLRNGLVVGLDKAAVGQYLGEIGKADKASTPVWEQDWFHKELLTAFCSSFDPRQPADVLGHVSTPGEAQMIDRILQAFAESVARQCEESASGSLKVFSTDERQASDAAYLLSFSIIMLNTDLHNDNIRADRKMKLKDFVRNNTNYGKEISDKDLPFEYLEGIYTAIKEEQIRTLGEGAEGSMTAERWKDVMRSASSFQSHEQTIKTGDDAKDLKELLLESSWQPILSAVSGLWGMVPYEVYQADMGVPDQNATLVGARLGIDLAHLMLSGASSLSRPDIFQDLFMNVCHMSGLLSDFTKSTEERMEIFLNSIEHQSAFTVAISIAEENGDAIGLDGWKCVWNMLFELRDCGLLSGMKRPSIMKESDPDLLSPEARYEFCARMANWDESFDAGTPQKGRTLMSFVFGSSESLEGGKNSPAKRRVQSSDHGKEDYLIWDELAPSDDDGESGSDDTEYLSFPTARSPKASFGLGATFENQIANETTVDSEEMGVTGLERIDRSHSHSRSLRARVRHRLSQLLDFYGLVAESRFLSEEGLSDAINALVEIIRDSSTAKGGVSEDALVALPLSPASEALAEILLCEIALKNRDRFAMAWNNVLRAHYNSRLTYRHSRGAKQSDEKQLSETLPLTPGIEKCVTGILRLCVWSSSRNVMANQVLSTLNILHPPLGALVWSPLELNLDKHLAEGLWRICRNVDGLIQIDEEGWGGVLGLAEWCATRGGLRHEDNVGSLAEDDPSLQAFRSLHLILHAVELKDALTEDYQLPRIVRSVRCLVEAGERGHCPKLSIAGLDLLQVLHTRMEALTAKDGESQHFLRCWLPVLEAICEPAERSRNGSVRQQAISLLTDTLLDRHGSKIPVDSGLCEIMNTICIPLASKRITDLLRIPYDVQNDLEENMIELELCISLLFKPFLHHLKALVSVEQEFVGIWISMLGIMTQLLGEESKQSAEENAAVREGGLVTREKLFLTTKELGSEHLRNAVMVLSAMGVLVGDVDTASEAQEFSSVTWSAIGSIGYCKPYLDEWKSSACQ
ncbi:hypothetical protein ACHAXT_010673 [Thalassiosira profunda]